jgi:hypothetical protein
MPTKSPGRPRGTSEISKVRKLIEPHREAILARLVEIAKSTDKEAVRAAEILLDRLAVKPRPQAELVHCPGLREATTLTAKAEAVIASVAQGEISAEAGEKLLRLVGILKEVLAHDDLERRLRFLEGKAPRTIDNDTGEELA